MQADTTNITANMNVMHGVCNLKIVGAGLQLTC